MSVNALINIPSSTGTDVQWIEWHKALKSRYGKKEANVVFLRAWERRKNAKAISGSAANTSRLRNYLQDNGIDLSADGIMAYPSNILDSVTSGFESAFGVGKTIFMIVIIMVLLFAAVFLFNIAKNPAAAIGAVSPMPNPSPQPQPVQQ